ncbi:PERQ amino acid-rich with GYF domain-containing protein 2-like, partial [Asbolus verrucosus]
LGLESELDKIKKKTIRRNAPPGEDLKSIKTVLKSIKDQNVTVQEFIALIAPSTGDNGAALRAVMNDDLTSFRKLVRKVYDTITQDNSDVLLNQQLQLSEYYKEKKKLLNSRMMNMIEEIYSYAPNFDFDRHAAEGEKYLNEILPIPAELAIEPEEIEMMKRQAAYHRLQWLRSEGERLNEENNSLKKRLTQMKRMHMEEQRKMAQIERMAEQKKEALEAAQEEKRETLEILNQSLEKTIIAQEMSLRQTEDSAVLQPKPTKQTGAVRKVKSKGKTSVRRTRKPKWNEVAASDIEERTLEESR